MWVFIRRRWPWILVALIASPVILVVGYFVLLILAALILGLAIRSSYVTHEYYRVGSSDNRYEAVVCITHTSAIDSDTARIDIVETGDEAPCAGRAATIPWRAFEVTWQAENALLVEYWVGDPVYEATIQQITLAQEVFEVTRLPSSNAHLEPDRPWSPHDSHGD